MMNVVWGEERRRKSNSKLDGCRRALLNQKMNPLPVYCLIENWKTCWSDTNDKGDISLSRSSYCYKGGILKGVHAQVFSGIFLVQPCPNTIFFPVMTNLNLTEDSQDSNTNWTTPHHLNWGFLHIICIIAQRLLNNNKVWENVKEFPECIVDWWIPEVGCQSCPCLSIIVRTVSFFRTSEYVFTYINI